MQQRKRERAPAHEGERARAPERERERENSSWEFVHWSAHDVSCLRTRALSPVCVCMLVCVCVCECVYEYVCVCTLARACLKCVFHFSEIRRRCRGVESREVGGWGRDPKKCTGRDWGMGSSTI